MKTVELKWSNNDAINAVYLLVEKATNHKADKKELTGKTDKGVPYKLVVDNTKADKALIYTEGAGKNAVRYDFTIAPDGKLWFYDSKTKKSEQIAGVVDKSPKGIPFSQTIHFKGVCVDPLVKTAQAILVDLGAKGLQVDGKFQLASKRAYEKMTEYYAMGNYSDPKTIVTGSTGMWWWKTPVTKTVEDISQNPYKTEVSPAWWDVAGYMKMTLNNSIAKVPVAEKVYKLVLNEYYKAHVTDVKYDGKKLSFKFDGKEVKEEGVKDYLYTAIRNYQARINSGRKDYKDKMKQDGLFGNETLQTIVDMEKAKEKAVKGSGDKDIMAIKVRDFPKIEKTDRGDTQAEVQVEKEGKRGVDSFTSQKMQEAEEKGY